LKIYASPVTKVLKKYLISGKQYVEDELKKREQAKEAERLRIQKLQEEAQEKRDREEYERLKKKFESN
jgi:hypothetical protein